MKEVENSLRRLGTDHIDLYQIHRPRPETDLEETLGVLTDLVRQGKVRYIGCSTFPAQMIVESHWVSEGRNLERFVCEQPPYSIFTRAIELDVLPTCQRYGMGVIVWSPLNGGWLTGKYRQGQDIPPGSRAERAAKQWTRPIAQRFDMTREPNQRKLRMVDELGAIADKAGISMTHMANAWVLAHPAVTSAIIGPRTMEQMEDVLAGADVVLSDETLDAIDEVVEPGTTLEVADRGWVPPWMEPSERRR
jgi:aryl-alcohol dehydrogenase-like predicted oxidoreductase